MNSESVGRTATIRAFIVVRTVTPSSRPISASCSRTPAWLWNAPPSASVTRWRRCLVSMRSTRSPGARGRGIARLPRHSELDRRALGRKATGALPQRAERAQGPGGRGAARRARHQLDRLALLVEALMPAGEEATEERGLRSRRAVFERVEHLLVSEVPVACRHGTFLDLVVDPPEHAVRRHLALAQSHQGLHLLREAVAAREHGVLAGQVPGLPPQHVPEEHRGLV